MLRIGPISVLSVCMSCPHACALQKRLNRMEMPFGELTQLGPRNHGLGGAGDFSHGKRQFSGLSSPVKSIGSPSPCCDVHSTNGPLASLASNP